MTNPTEPPEERDSLAEIEARLEKAVPFRKPADDDPEDVLFLWTLVASDPERPFHTCEESENYGDCEHPEALAESELIAHAQADLRTLINEVKERRAEQNRSLYDVDVRDRRIAALGAEVKELREENAELESRLTTAHWRRLESRIKQMEEALRELLDALDGREALHKAGVRNAAGAASPELTLAAMKRVDAARDAARAALSPSDTEEPR